MNYCNCRIPNIPILDYKRDDEGNFLFKSETAEITFDQEYKILAFNVLIKFYDKIFVEFWIDDDVEFPMDDLVHFDLKIENSEKIVLESVFGTIEENHVRGNAKRMFINNEIFENNDNVKVWIPIEELDIFQPVIMEFKDPYLNGLFLKESHTTDPNLPEIHMSICKNYNNCDIVKESNGFGFCEKNTNIVREELLFHSEDKRNSFSQFKSIDSFLFFEGKYSEISSRWEKVIENIFSLSIFYSAEIFSPHMWIIEADKKTEFRIIPHEKSKENSLSLFSEFTCTFQRFLDSSYSAYVQLKKEIDIDLLLHYYAGFKNESYVLSKIALGSIFLETLKNQYNYKGFLFNQLSHIFNELELNTEILLEKLQPRVYERFFEIEIEIIDDFVTEDRIIVHWIFDYFMKSYLLQHLVKYRNQIIHSGKVIIKKEDPNEIIKSCHDKLSEIFKFPNMPLLENKSIILETVYEHLKDNFTDLNIVKYPEKETNALILEELIDLILLKLLDVNCPIAKFDYFDLWNQNILRINSKELLDEFKN